MKSRVNEFQKGKSKVLKEFNSVSDAIKFVQSKRAGYTVKTKVERGLGWSIDKKTKTGWKSTGKFYS